MRWLVLLVIALVVIALSLRKAGTWSLGRPRNRVQRDELVKDPVCQTYIVMSRALKSQDGGMTVHFCSRECAERYARGERRG